MLCMNMKGFGGDAAWMDACEACADELRSSCTHPEPMAQWISVSERLPEPDRDVLAWCGFHITAGFKSARRTGKAKHHDWSTEDGTNPVFNVSHWMPLSEKP